MSSSGSSSTASPAGAKTREVAYRRLGVAERRAQLIAAALRLFAHRAPEEVSLDDVAAAVGVSRPLVYRYFPGGKPQLYEAALRSAADELVRCFTEPLHGAPTQRLGRALDRVLTFVDEHDAGFTALLRGGSVAVTSRTTAIVDGVRRTAVDQVLYHFQVADPGPRLRLMVRTWISAVEAACLIWLDEGKQPAAAELRDWLVDHFLALLAVTAQGDRQAAEAARRVLVGERADPRAAGLAARLRPLLDTAAGSVAPPAAEGTAEA